MNIYGVCVSIIEPDVLYIGSTKIVSVGFVKLVRRSNGELIWRETFSDEKSPSYPVDAISKEHLRAIVQHFMKTYNLPFIGKITYTKENSITPPENYGIPYKEQHLCTT